MTGSRAEAVPRAMTAVLLLGHGGYDQLVVRDDVPVPRPRPGEALVRVGAAGVNNTDINTRTAWYSRAVATASQGEAIVGAQAADSGWTGAPLTFPRIQGADAAGRIVAVGEGVDPARIGERVLIDPIFRPRAPASAFEAIYFGSECDGAFAEYAVAPAANAHAIDSSLSDAELASFPCSAGAAANMVARAEVAAGETVLVTGASGGVGSAAVQLTRRRGARVIAVADAAKAGAVLALGAAQALPRDADLLDALGEESIDVALDVVGGAAFPTLLRLLRRGGRYATAGAIAGPVVPLDLRTLYLKDLRLLGCTVFAPGVFADLVRAIAAGEIRPVVAATYPLRDIVAAQQAFLAKRHTGKIVLLPRAD